MRCQRDSKYAPGFHPAMAGHGHPLRSHLRIAEHSKYLGFRGHSAAPKKAGWQADVEMVRG